MISLPEPTLNGNTSLEQILVARRSIRNFSDKNLSLEQIAQLLWAAQGTTSSNGFRTAPSAGALYPLVVYVVSGSNKGLAEGVYRYNANGHTLSKLSEKDFRDDFCNAGLSQTAIQKAPVTFLITGVFKKTTVKYGQRGLQYVFMEAGHAGQNILLQAEALGLGAVPIGAFQEKEIERLMKFSADEHPLYLISVGHKMEH
ncbi:MAG: SagB/ThcOx family dehydrogenase [Desulfobacteraceae bacterium]|nr:SagB/ThcOx family dehydrogenase [Desulfobacteraceae bacterium]MBC2755756.1 SagB/ThcOx family dehydrogenase [Desulfobacteraceae bacterium]